MSENTPTSDQCPLSYRSSGLRRGARPGVPHPRRPRRRSTRIYEGLRARQRRRSGNERCGERHAYVLCAANAETCELPSRGLPQERRQPDP